MARAGIEQGPVFRIPDGVPDGDKQVGAGVFQQQLVNAQQRLSRVVPVARHSADQGTAQGHVQCGGHSLVCHVRHDQPPLATGQRHEVEEVSAYHPGGSIVGCYVPAWNGRVVLWQEAGLDALGDFKLAFQALTFSGGDLELIGFNRDGGLVCDSRKDIGAPLIGAGDAIRIVDQHHADQFTLRG